MTDRELMERYKMALEAIGEVLSDLSCSLEKAQSARSIASKALETK